MTEYFCEVVDIEYRVPYMLKGVYIDGCYRAVLDILFWTDHVTPPSNVIMEVPYNDRLAPEAAACFRMHKNILLTTRGSMRHPPLQRRARILISNIDHI